MTMFNLNILKILDMIHMFKRKEIYLRILQFNALLNVEAHATLCCRECAGA